jgi:pyruvate/2-oxoglutarate dehydrogenase complex dihydrolipoamide acyltransferase (E2) component
MTPVELPKANENLTEATLDRWLVSEGQSVAEKQPLCVIITDKATFELPAPAAGMVRRIFAPGRGVFPVGYILCALGGPGEGTPEEFAARNERTLAAHRGMTLGLMPAGMPGTEPAPVALRGASAVRATPAARRLAREHGLNLAEVLAAAGNISGPLTEKEVQAYLERQGRR